MLKDYGFAKSDTFQKFRADSAFQALSKGQILWVDEAGFLSVKDMNWLVQFAGRNGCRLVLSGDTKHHHGVERGDALRILQNSGAVNKAVLTGIIRQQNAVLREAVIDLSQGRTEAAFDKLDGFGAVHEFEDKAERLAAIACTHLATRKEGKSSLIVAPTHAECRVIADAVRDQQKKQGLLGSEEYRITRLGKANLTESQKRDPINYEAGQVVEFHRRARGGFKSGERWEVASADSQGVVVMSDGQAKILPLGQAGSFDLYTCEEITLAAGDTVRITKNFRGNAHHFRNNELCTVKAIDGDSIILTDNRMMNCQRALHVDQGIAVTSHAAQGKTVDQVIVSVPVAAFCQANQAQFYVSMSRVRASMHLFTDSKVALKEAVTRPSQRLSPYEAILKSGSRRDWRDVVAAIHRTRLLRKNLPARLQPAREPVKEIGREIQR